jgi:hypothetical protein
MDFDCSDLFYRLAAGTLDASDDQKQTGSA